MCSSKKNSIKNISLRLLARLFDHFFIAKKTEAKPNKGLTLLQKQNNEKAKKILSQSQHLLLINM